MTALRVGLVGAGPWADRFHAPMLAAGPETELVAVWARRTEAAEALVARHGGTAVATLEALLDRCDAVAFAVPPDVQAQYVVRAAAAGKPLLLEKPIGLDLREAEHVAAVVAESGVPNQIMLTNRYHHPVRTFLASASRERPLAAMATHITGALLPGEPFATPWRLERGVLLDLGPHVLDLLDAVLGPVAEIQGRGDPRRWFAITAVHESGAISQATLSAVARVERNVTQLRLFTERGELEVDLSGAATDRGTVARIRADFAATAVSGKPHHLDVRRALHLQRLIHWATP